MTYSCIKEFLFDKKHIFDWICRVSNGTYTLSTEFDAWKTYTNKTNYKSKINHSTTEEDDYDETVEEKNCHLIKKSKISTEQLIEKTNKFTIIGIFTTTIPNKPVKISH